MKQETPTKTHGGKRPGAGQPKKAPTKSYPVRLNAVEHAAIKAMGGLTKVVRDAILAGKV